MAVVLVSEKCCSDHGKRMRKMCFPCMLKPSCLKHVLLIMTDNIPDVVSEELTAGFKVSEVKYF